MNCLIVEDQPPAQRLLRRYVEQTAGLQLSGLHADPTAAVHTLRHKPIDLLLLDVHLPRVSGLDLLRLLERPPHVILTTAYDRYALESYELNVVDYLLKPIAYERFLAAIAKVPTEREAAEAAPTELFIKSGHAYVRVEPKDIRYIRSDADYTELHETDRRHLSPKPLHHWEAALTGARFLRVHKSYLVNLAYVARLYGNRLVLGGGEEIPLGRVYREAVKKRLLG